MVVAQRRVRRLDDQGVVRGQCHCDNSVVVVVHQSCCASRHRIGHVKERRGILLQLLLLLVCCHCQDLLKGLALLNGYGCISNGDQLLLAALDQVVRVERSVRAVTKDSVDRRWTRWNLGQLGRRGQAERGHRRGVLLDRLLKLLVDCQLELQLVRVQKLVTAA